MAKNGIHSHHGFHTMFFSLTSAVTSAINYLAHRQLCPKDASLTFLVEIARCDNVPIYTFEDLYHLHIHPLDCDRLRSGV